MKKIERNLHGSSQLSILNVGGFFHLREENLHRIEPILIIEVNFNSISLHCCRIYLLQC